MPKLSEKIRMRACSSKKERQFHVVLFPYKQPISFYMTFPTASIIARQFVGAIFGWQLPVGFKDSDNGLKQFHVISAFATTLRVLTERSCHTYRIHILKSLKIETSLLMRRTSLCALQFYLPVNEYNCFLFLERSFQQEPLKLSDSSSEPFHLPYARSM